jgi:hypothetical protein
MSTHTWGRAIPVSKYYDTHPEYFALQRGGKAGDGSRLKDDQYCISNPEVRELIYQDLVAHIQRGYDSVDLGQPDGFRPCQCDKCRELFGTGDDWSEKIWILHRQIAERLDREHPGKQVTIMSYILTADPPKSFKSFPKNVRIMLCGTNEEDIAPWRGIEVPRGFTCYLYNWCPNLTSNYTPMRTPRFVEEQARRLNRLHAQAIYRDGPGNLYGLEGPVFYTMNRMFDDPDHSTAAELVREFCDAAFGKAAAPMQSFYDQLYHAIDLEAEYLGTRCPGWTYHDIYGKRRKSLSDPFQLLGFLYTPSLMGSLERELSAAERQADHARAKQRLALVRREFDYLKHTVAVVHLYQAYQVAPDVSSRDRLLDAIDARNAHIATFFRGKTAPPMPGFAATLFPPSGHYPEHLRLAHDGYQGPFANTAFNWDTKLMRTLPPPGARKLSVPRVSGTMTIDSPQWSSVPAQPLAALPTDHRVKQATSVRVICDEANLYIRFEAELGGYVVRGNPPRRESDLSSGESFDIYLAPQPGREVYYRFMVAPNGAKFDAASGFITDAMDPRFGKDDPDWNGEWRYENRVADDRWTGLVTIPLKTMNATLSPGSSWRANFGRVHGQGKLIEHSQWSAPIGAGNISDHAAMGELMLDQGK